MAPAGYGSRVEGAHAVRAAAAAGRVRKLWVEKGRLERSDITDLIAVVGEDQVAVVADVRSLAETEAPQGLVADCVPIDPVSVDMLAGEGAAIIVLDHIEDPHNVGAIARSALATGMTGMIMSSRRQAPLTAAAFKAAAGALETMPVAVVGSIPESLSRLKTGGTWVVGLDAEGDSPLFGLELLTEPVAMVIGGEGSGLSTLAAKRCDVVVSIPMAEGTESLNASVSAALACFEIMRIRRAASTWPG